uniref:UAS domain-containing protein n=1 Tax=Acrobeloides nanus TaxID=290746 RepID=A0A914CWT4_9BILA
MTEVAGSSNSNNLLLEQFKDICAVDTEIARRFLTESNWNLEAAVHLYFHANDPEAIQNDDNARNEHEIRRRNVANPRNEAPANHNAVVRRSSESQLDTWSAWFRALLALPFRLAYFSLREIFLFIYALFGGNALAITNPREDLQKFLTAIANYPNSERINWFNGTYNEVLNEAKSSVRFLLVYLHNPSHQSTETFLDKVLFNKIFSDFVRDNNIIMWGTDVRTNEGYKVATSLHELTYPCLSLICLRENRMAC